MKILVIGGGGREYGIAKRLSEDPRVDKLYVLPGNGGISEFAECFDVKATDLDGVRDFVREHPVDFAVVTPDDPLALGMADLLRGMGVPCFGPSKAAARIEASKIFSKNLMMKYSIPTAKAESFDSFAAASLYIAMAKYPVVVKADGLALGKGVFICRNHHEAVNALRELMEDRLFGASGERVLVEEFLEGPEVTVLAFTDGRTIKPMVASMDHKTAGEGGTGPNTGGMGVIAPNPFYTEEAAAECMEKIFLPTIRAMEEEGCPFTGCLYFGLMLTKDGPKVIEYNCRFGDPEAQTVLPLLESNLLDAMLATEEGTLDRTPVVLSNRAACCVVLASGGYPGKYEKGKPITIGKLGEGVHIVHAGTKKTEDGFVTAGGRVLNVIAAADSLKEAVAAAYEGVLKVGFDGMYVRRDIGRAALDYLDEKKAYDLLRRS
ncbi:MAG: phosphoribosylamine--glycine ligase [Clostridia bacterium]|nr:phosphoribosylamine--glycine ligase [Clostridia bacterium]